MDDRNRLTDRVALVTGAGSGIGRATARRLAEQGARIGALGRTETQLLEAVEEIRSRGGDALPLVADVRRPEEVRAAVERLLTAYGRLDIVVANAGINGTWAPVWELEPEEWDETLEINLKGTFLTIKYAVPHMMDRGGAVVVVSSVNGTRTFFNGGSAAYSSSKAAQVALTKIVALELARFGIRVNVVCPGMTATEARDNTRIRNIDRVRAYGATLAHTVPLTGDRPASAEQVADLILFLASDAAGHITGTEVWIDGGKSLL